MLKKVLTEIAKEVEDCTDGDFCPIKVVPATIQIGGSESVTIYFDTGSMRWDKQRGRWEANFYKITINYKGITRFRLNINTQEWEIDHICSNEGTIKNPLADVAEIADNMFD